MIVELRHPTQFARHFSAQMPQGNHTDFKMSAGEKCFFCRILNLEDAPDFAKQCTTYAIDRIEKTG
jgi:hypothetical protein